MKRALVRSLLFVVAIQPVLFAQEKKDSDTPEHSKIESLFGLNLAEELDFDDEGLTELSVSEYTFDLKDIDTSMEVCFVYITPISKRIHTIIASRDFDTEKEALEVQENIMTEMSAKYGPEAPRDSEYKSRKTRRVAQERAFVSTHIDTLHENKKITHIILRLTFSDIGLQAQNFQETERYMLESFNNPDL